MKTFPPCMSSVKIHLRKSSKKNKWDVTMFNSESDCENLNLSLWKWEWSSESADLEVGESLELRIFTWKKTCAWHQFPSWWGRDTVSLLEQMVWFLNPSQCSAFSQKILRCLSWSRCIFFSISTGCPLGRIASMTVKLELVDPPRGWESKAAQCRLSLYPASSAQWQYDAGTFIRKTTGIVPTTHGQGL